MSVSSLRVQGVWRGVLQSHLEMILDATVKITLNFKAFLGAQQQQENYFSLVALLDRILRNGCSGIPVRIGHKRYNRRIKSKRYLFVPENLKANIIDNPQGLPWV